MEPIIQTDLDAIQHYGGQVPTDSSYEELTTIYAKLDLKKLDTKLQTISQFSGFYKIGLKLPIIK